MAQGWVAKLYGVVSDVAVDFKFGFSQFGEVATVE